MEIERCPSCGWPGAKGRPCPRCHVPVAIVSELPSKTSRRARRNESPAQTQVEYSTPPTAQYSAPPQPSVDAPPFVAESPVQPAAERRSGRRKRSLSAPAGLGGWLVLPIIGLFLTILWNARSLIFDYLPFYGSSAWGDLTTPGSHLYLPLFEGLYLFETFCAGVLTVAPAILLVLIFQKHRVAPRLMVAFYAFVCMSGCIEAGVLLTVYPNWMNSVALSDLAGTATTQAARALLQVLILGAVWIPYFLRSKRVKNTFVNPTEVGELETGMFAALAS